MGLWETLESNSGAVIAAFTVVLAFTTIIYVVVSVKLLKQSRNALIADIILRVTGVCRREMREMRGGEEIRIAAFIKGWMKSYYKTFVEIDKRMGKDISKLLDPCLDLAVKEWEKGEKKMKEKEKVRKEIKRNRGSGTS